MRLLVATLRYPPYVAGGYEELTFDAVEALRARGHEVDVICGKGERLADAPGIWPLLEPALPEAGEPQNLFERSHAGSNLERLRLHFLRRSNLHATRRVLAETKSECLLFFNLGLVSLAPLLAARRAGVPTLGYVTDPWPLNHWLEDWRSNEASARKGLRLALLERAWRAWRDHVRLGPLLVSSDHLRRRFVESGIPLADQELLPLALPPARTRELARRTPPSRRPGEPLRVASLSMLWEGKGVHVLIEAAQRARREGVDLVLEIAGDGPPAYRERLEALAGVPELAGRVHFHGLVERARAGELLASCHALVLPSLWGEPFPLATLEGLALGLAVVASDAGGTPEQFADGVEGRIVPAGDPTALAGVLGELDRDDARRVALGRAGLGRVGRDYTMEVFATRLEEALARATGARP